MARPREPIDLIAAKNKKHLTKAEYENRKNSEKKAVFPKKPSFTVWTFLKEGCRIENSM